MDSKISADETPATAVDAIVRDACDAQRDAGIVPTPIDNRQFIQPIVERLDNKPQPAAPSASKKPGASEAEYYRRGGTPGSYGDFDVKRDYTPKILPPASARAQGSAIIGERMRLLRSKPEWLARIKTVNPLAMTGSLGEEKRKQACAALWAIIEDSCRVFGRLGAKEKPIYSLPARAK